MNGQTAYEQSVAAARALMESAQAEQQQAAQQADVAAMHKKAFRAAFDLLKELYPPKNDAEYWTFAAKRVALAHTDNKGNDLCMELLMAVYAYLEKEVKKEMGVEEHAEDHVG